MFLGASWEDPGVRRNVRKIQTPHGLVVAYEVYGYSKPRSAGGQPEALRSFVPGFYVRDLTKEEYAGGDGMAVKSIPANLQDEISKILKQEGYVEPINFE